MTLKRSITEIPNYLSSDIDLASPCEMVRIFRQADAQIFSGYMNYPGLYDPETIDRIAALAQRAAATIANPKGCVVLSGAGTSGRLAMFSARVFNQLLQRHDPPCFRYLMAGGDAALIQAQEGAEDDPNLAIADLRRCVEGCDDIFYVGITCGFSATYIAAQLEEMLSRSDGFAVLLGFNPVELARDTPVEGWPHTIRYTARRVDQSAKAAPLNPIIGPEPITGSTRMKSGSATKILVETLFHAAVQVTGRKMTPAAIRKLVLDLLMAFESASRRVYFPAREIGQLVAVGGETLRQGGHIYYVGPAGINASGEFVGDTNAAILGLIDASECPPTYGADFEDVRGFLVGGWKALFPHKNVDLSSLGSHYRIGVEDFVRDKLASLSSRDLCVFIGAFAGLKELLAQIHARKAQTAAITWSGRTPRADYVVSLRTPPHRVLGWGPLELQIKLVLNALTTGAHVLSGKVFGNRMVDLRISNNKLFHRTVGIIGDLMKVSQEEATEALLRAVHQTDSVTETQRGAPIRNHIDTARSVSKVVPKALLMATGQFNYAEATDTLARNPIVRAAIQEYVK